MPDEIADLHYLQGFYANGNSLRAFPKQLLLLPILQKIDLSVNQIYEIPPNTATAFIDRHIFYNNKHISTELLTIQFVDFARARPMTEGERSDLLRKVFQASGW